MPNRKSRRAFTLLELIIVITILALTATFVLPNISAIFGLGMKGACVEVGEMIRFTYNQAVIKNKVFRIVYDLEGDNYWIEYGEPIEEEKKKEGEEEETRSKEAKKEEENEEEKESRIAIRANFSMYEDESGTFEKESLPSGISFHGIYTEHSGRLVKEGKEFVLFFPNGSCEKAFVYLEDRNERIYTIEINPVIGTVKILENYAEPEEKKES